MCLRMYQHWQHQQAGKVGRRRVSWSTHFYPLITRFTPLRDLNKTPTLYQMDCPYLHADGKLKTEAIILPIALGKHHYYWRCNILMHSATIPFRPSVRCLTWEEVCVWGGKGRALIGAPTNSQPITMHLYSPLTNQNAHLHRNGGGVLLCSYLRFFHGVTLLNTIYDHQSC